MSVVRRACEGVRLLFNARDGPRVCLGGREVLVGYVGRGVVFESASESLDFAIGRAGVLAAGGMSFSDVGGDGGVRVSDTSEDTDFVGGVAIVGEEFDVVGDNSDVADCGRAKPSTRGEGFLRRCLSAASSAWRSLSCLISASILRSPSSSRNRCVSILSASLSCSPALISSSAMTPRSIDMLYFESRSSNDDVVFLACRS